MKIVIPYSKIFTYWLFSSTLFVKIYRLAQINVENTKENRRRYRELLYKTEGLGEHISGAIMFEEALLSEDD